MGAAIDRQDSLSGNGMSRGWWGRVTGRVRRRRRSRSSAVAIECLDRRVLPATLVSHNAANTDSGAGRSYGSINTGATDAVQISDDGRYVMFHSRANNLNNTPSLDDALGETDVDIFRADLTTGAIETVNVNSSGTGDLSNGMGGYAVMSPNGRYVAFEYTFTVISGQENDILAGVPQDNGGSSRIFMRDMQTGTTILVSNAANGGGLGAAMAFSPDSRFLAYTDRNLEPGVSSSASGQQLYVYEISTGNLELASAINGTTGLTGVGDKQVVNNNFAFSANGRRIAFVSEATNLVPGDTNNVADVFLRDLDTNTTTLVSINSAGTGPGDDVSQSTLAGPIDVSADGTKVLFASKARNLVAGATFNSPSDNGLYVRDLAAGTTRIVNIVPGEAKVRSIIDGGQAYLTPDARYVFWSTGSDLFRSDLVTNTTIPIDLKPDGSPDSQFASTRFVQGLNQHTQRAVSDDGRFVVFESTSTEFVSGFTPGAGTNRQIYIRDLATNVTTLLSHAVGAPTTGAAGRSFDAVISRNGQRVAFQAEAAANNLVATDTNNESDIFSATIDTTSVDFGDAPSSTQSGLAASYPTRLRDDGARHVATGATLGPGRDGEADGVPFASANGDDTSGSDDEDGIAIVSDVVSTPSNGALARLTVDLKNPHPTSNKLDAFIDFNRDGDWSDAGEQIATALDLGTTAGLREISFTVPAGASGGQSVARFRLSSAGGLGATGLASDGEVEDHTVTIVALPAVTRTYRAFNPNANFHFFTTSFPEFAATIAAGYRDESSGQDGFAVMPSQSPGSVPVFRVYNLALGYHYYTINQAERDFLVNLVPAPLSGPDTRTTGWRDEGSIGFIPSSSTTGATTIYRLYNNDSGVHLLTHNPAVRDAVLAITEAGTGRRPWVQHSHFGFAFAIAASERLLDPGLFPTSSPPPPSSVSLPVFAAALSAGTPVDEPESGIDDHEALNVSLIAVAGASLSTPPDVTIGAQNGDEAEPDPLASHPAQQLSEVTSTLVDGLDGVMATLMWD